MTKEQHEYVAQLKIASNVIVKILKDTRDIQKNMNFYLNSKNEYIKKEYLEIKRELASTILLVNTVKDPTINELDTSIMIQEQKDITETFNTSINNHIDELIRNEKITSKMATSLINDSTTTYNICTNLLRIANIIFIRDESLRKLGEIENEN
jgi:phosphate:Na+ symporter